MTPAKPQIDQRAMTQPRRGLRREQAACYVGVSPSCFDALIRDGLMPKPVRLRGAVVWDMRAIDLAFDRLSDDQDAHASGTVNPWDAATAIH